MGSKLTRQEIEKLTQKEEALKYHKEKTKQTNNGKIIKK